MDVTVIIPLKALAAAKGRLAGVLEPAQRQAFAAWMAQRVIAAALAVDAVTDVLVVAGDEAAAAVGTEAGARVLVVSEPGLDAAMAAADAATAGARATLVLAADLPEVSADDILDVIDAAAGAEDVVVVAPTRDGGTGALLRRPPSVITTAYGGSSAAEHERLARAAGARVVTVSRTALANDVDTPGELSSALASAAARDVGCPPRTSH